MTTARARTGDRIVAAALASFATEGFDATSHDAVARKPGPFDRLHPAEPRPDCRWRRCSALAGELGDGEDRIGIDRSQILRQLGDRLS